MHASKVQVASATLLRPRPFKSAHIWFETIPNHGSIERYRSRAWSFLLINEVWSLLLWHVYTLHQRIYTINQIANYNTYAKAHHYRTQVATGMHCPTIPAWPRTEIKESILVAGTWAIPPWYKSMWMWSQLKGQGRVNMFAILPCNCTGLGWPCMCYALWAQAHQLCHCHYSYSYLVS